MLDIARIEERGQLALSLEPVRVGALVADVLDLVRPLADAGGVRLDPATGLAAGPVVLGDHQRLRQVLLNVVSNAIRYNRTGGSVRIEVGSPAAERVRVAVIDTGRGIEAEQFDRLFVPFERLDAATWGVEGTASGWRCRARWSRA